MCKLQKKVRYVMLLEFQEMRLEGGWLMLKPTPQSLGTAMAAVRKHKDKLYDCKITEHRERRSLDANAYAWVLMGKLSEAMRLPVEEVYKGYIQNLGNNYLPVCIREKEVERFKKSWTAKGLGWVVGDLGESQVPGCRNLAAYYGSSVYDKKTFCRLLDLIIEDCRSLEIETLSEEKLSLLKEEWE